jgi:hypothetical protein
MEISSPPYPKNSASPRVLYANLRDLYLWTAEHRDWANLQARRLNAPESPFIPPLGKEPLPGNDERFIELAVSDMFISWQALRKIRERYDDVVRNYESEDDWQSDAGVFHRINIIKMAAMLLSVAFLEYERREAKGQSLMTNARREFLLQLKKAFSEIHDSFQDKDSDDDEDFDFDRLFNPEE